MRGLAKMKTRDYNCAALTIFERIEFAVNGGSVSKAPLERRVAEIAKNWSADLFRYRDVQNTLPYRGFFVRAVLHTIASAQVGGVELTDERNHASAGWGRGRISQGTQDVGVKGLKRAATVSHVRAVADADSSEPTMKLHDGTANGTVCWSGFNPTPSLALLSA